MFRALQSLKIQADTGGIRMQRCRAGKPANKGVLHECL